MSEIQRLLRAKYSLPVDGYLIGSFQRDTEGHDLISPKLEKGPDHLATFLCELKTHQLVLPTKLFDGRPMHVVLAGWRRQYIINRLQESNIPYSYFELPPQQVINELYQTLDLYPVTSRYEGGPQSLVECGLLGIPCVSRDVGMASQVLPPESVNDRLFACIPSVPNVEHLKLPQGYAAYRKLIEEV